MTDWWWPAKWCDTALKCGFIPKIEHNCEWKIPKIWFSYSIVFGEYLLLEFTVSYHRNERLSAKKLLIVLSELVYFLQGRKTSSKINLEILSDSTTINFWPWLSKEREAWAVCSDNRTLSPAVGYQDNFVVVWKSVPVVSKVTILGGWPDRVPNFLHGKNDNFWQSKIGLNNYWLILSSMLKILYGFSMRRFRIFSVYEEALDKHIYCLLIFLKSR